MGKYAARVKQQALEAASFAEFFCRAQVLVPIPSSLPSAANSVQMSEQLARALLQVGLGAGLWRGLRRIRAVRKSATAPPGSRPTVENHYNSFAIDPCDRLPPRITLIDDVITKGRTLLAAAALLAEMSPNIEIRAFALLRTMGFVAEVERLLDPCVGEIRWRAGDAHRNP